MNVTILKRKYKVEAISKEIQILRLAFKDFIVGIINIFND
jgi:hypothetical protein